MRYLKKFNESFSSEEIDEIKDIFQDLIDEFNIIKDDKLIEDPGIYISYGESGPNIQVEIYTNDNEYNKEFFKMEPHINKIIERLKSMNYFIDNEFDEDAYTIINISKTSI